MTERRTRPTLKLAVAAEEAGARKPARAGAAAPEPAAPPTEDETPLTPAEIAFARSLVIHEDEDVIAFSKPSGLAAQGGAGVTQSLDGLLAAFAKSNGKRPRLVHRLDRETSGVMVVGRTQPAAAALSAAFASRDAIKTYIAVVCGGAPKPASAAIDIPLKKMARAGVDMVRAARAGDSGVLNARTRYRTLSVSNEAALVSLQPETGRLHQLRAHLSMIGHPIMGDGKYGGLFSIDGVQAPTMMLHALSLVLPHPREGILSISAPPSEAFVEACEALGLDIAAPLAAFTGKK